MQNEQFERINGRQWEKDGFRVILSRLMHSGKTTPDGALWLSVKQVSTGKKAGILVKIGQEESHYLTLANLMIRKISGRRASDSKFIEQVNKQKRSRLQKILDLLKNLFTKKQKQK